MKHFWNHWHQEYTLNLPEYHSTMPKVSSNLLIKLKDLVLVYDDCVPRHLWKTSIVTELYYSNSNNQIWGISIRVNRSGQTIKQPINKLYLLELTEENESKEMNWRTWVESHGERLPLWEKEKYDMETPNMQQGSVCYHMWLCYCKYFLNILIGK